MTRLHPRDKTGPRRAVWKWPLPLEVEFTLDMPEGAELLTIQAQYARGPGETGALWALVNPDAPQVTRRFQMVGTGARELAEGTRYAGTYQLTGGTFVAHVFEVSAGGDSTP